MTLELHIKGMHPQILKEIGDEVLLAEIQRWRILALTGLICAVLFAALFLVEVL